MKLDERRCTVRAVTCDRDVVRVRIQAPADLVRQVHEVLAEYAVPVDLVAGTRWAGAEFRMGFTVSRLNVDKIREPLERTVHAVGGAIDFSEHVGQVSLVGVGQLNGSDLVARLLTVLDLAGTATSWVSVTPLRTSAVVALDRVDEAVELLKREFRVQVSEPWHQGEGNA